MKFVCKVLSKTEAVDGDELTIDMEGQIITMKGCAEGDLDALKPGASYTVAFIPFVDQDHLSADNVAVKEAATPSEPVPTEHPLVIEPLDIADCEPAAPVDVIVPEVVEVAPVTELEVITAADVGPVPEAILDPLADPTAVAATETPATPESPESSEASAESGSSDPTSVAPESSSASEMISNDSPAESEVE